MSGLGNQLFQYATGRAVAERTNTRLRFDVSYFGIEPNREYALGDFHIRAELVGGEGGRAELLADPAAEDEYARERFGAKIFREQGHRLHPELVDDPPPDLFLAGYWQVAAYFEDYSDLVRRELRPRLAGATERRRAELAADADAVSVHVRRGDFVSDPDSARRFGALEPGYYERAAAAISERIANPRFHVFSDDPEWCAEHLELPGTTEIVSGGNAAHEDLALMAACRHSIVSNSTFAWWGGWLGERPDSMVVAPERCFRDPALEWVGLMPGRWQLV